MDTTNKLLLKLTVAILLLVCSFTSDAQSIDSLLLKKYPVIIGNIGFVIDSSLIVVGDVPVGEVSTFSFEIYNLGNDAITFTNGKSNSFISVQILPSTLQPGMMGTLIAEFDAPGELNLGEFDVEISIMSNDKQNPYKFLNLYMNLIEGTGSSYDSSYDTIPHIVFDHYNHDYGHLKRGKVLYHTFIISNTGGEPLYIDSVIPPKGITVIDYPRSAVLPGEKSILRLKINTRGRVGIQHQTVVVNSNDPQNSIVILGLHGSVRVYPTHKKTSDQCNEHQQRF